MTGPRYGAINTEYFASFFERDDPGGAMWALNFMQYRARAEYADGRESTLTGAEADDEYTPNGPLAAVGASIVLAGEVRSQICGDETGWDRIGVVRYPTRMAMVEMNMRDDFQELHHHKEAGMAFTIVVASFPEEVVTDTADPDDLLLVQMVPNENSPDLADGVESTRVARFSIENVLLGDERRFAEVRYDRISSTTASELARRPPLESTDSYAVIIHTTIDALATAAADLR